MVARRLTAGIVVAAGLVPIALAPAQSSSSPDDMNAMMSNSMMPGFDPDAGLRAAQTTRDPAKRIEILARPGTTRLQLSAGGHLAEVTLHVLKISPRLAELDAAKRRPWPANTLIGEVNPKAPFVLDSIDLEVDGCAIQMPPGQAGFTDPNSAELHFQRGSWVFEAHGSGDGDGHTIRYTFDREKVIAQNIGWYLAGYDARWSIDEDREVYPRDCHPAGHRRYAARAEPKASSPR